jgi:hypothetical protein
MNRLKTLKFWKQVFLGLVVVALLVGISFFLTLCKGENTQAAADAVKASAPLSSYYSRTFGDSFTTVVPNGMEQLVADLVEINHAFEAYTNQERQGQQRSRYDGRPRVPGSEGRVSVTYDDLVPYLDPLSNVRKLKGGDGFGGKWGPFVVVTGKDSSGDFEAPQEIIPCEATRAKFSSKVTPEYWDTIESSGRLIGFRFTRIPQS